MTRKDYIAIAEALRYGLGSFSAELDIAAKGKRSLAQIAQYHFASHIAEAMHTDNPRFDREHFLAVVRGERDLQSRPPRRKYDPRCGDALWTGDTGGAA